MKKTFFTYCLLTLSTVGAMRAATATDTLRLIQVNSRATQPIQSSQIEFALQAQIPTDATPKLKENLLKWTANVTAQITDDTTKTALNDPYGMLSPRLQLKYISQSTAQIKEYYKDMRESKIEEPYVQNHLLDLTLQKVCEMGGYITFLLSGEAYSGGAHGMHWREYATFRIRDGHLLTWNEILDAKQKSKFSTAVADGLLRYFEVQSFNDMKGRLAIDTPYSRTRFPLPQTNPAFLSDGLRIQYQYYEIAPYALGAPSCTLPYGKIMKYLTTAGKKAVKR